VKPTDRAIRGKDECLTTTSHTVEKSFFFARRVTLGSSIIRFIELIVRCGQPIRCVGKPRTDSRREALVGADNDMAPVMRRSGVSRDTQSD
jgi:hypothetical protein